MKGFLFTLDASIAMMVILVFSISLLSQNQDMDLYEEMKIQLVQDAIEVCSIDNPSDECVKNLLKKTNTKIEFGCENSFNFERKYPYSKINLNVC